MLAASAIANIVRSSFGPVGLDKMMVDDQNEVMITNDGATILKQLDVEHPAAKTLVNLAYLMLVVAILLRCVTLAPRELVGYDYARLAYVIYQSFVSFDSVLMMAELFTFMWTSVNFGVLTITLVQMMVDLSLFIVFFSVILIGFCLPF